MSKSQRREVSLHSDAGKNRCPNNQENGRRPSVALWRQKVRSDEHGGLALAVVPQADTLRISRSNL
jgi:hypothetical protein